MTEEDTSEFFRIATASNLLKMKYVAIVLILENVLFLIVAGFFVNRNAYTDFATIIGHYWINTIFFIPPAIIILLTIQTPNKDEISKRHPIIENLIIAFLLVGVTISCIIAGDSTFYFVAIIFLSLAICKKFKGMLMLDTFFFVFFASAILLSDWSKDNKIIGIIEAFRATGISVIIFWIGLKSKIKAFQKDKLIKLKNMELAEANNILKDLSMLDGLTCIPNRRSFDAHLSSEWKRAARENSRMGLLLMDIDYFKKYNDHYGHQQGDECLRLVAKALQGRINRTGDMIARYGGEEFVAILPNDDLAGTALFGENLRKTVAALKIEHKSLPWNHVSISIGAASCTPINSSLEGLIKSADEALYKAKEKGRNRVEK